MHKSRIFGLICCLIFPLSAHSEETQVQRGAHVALEVCNACHSLKYIKYNDLMQIGFTKAQVDSMRGDKEMGAPLISQMAPQDELGMFGTVPPDLSLMAKAREGGANYIYSMITGFYVDAKGQTQNHAFPGIKMPDVLMISQADAAGKAAIEKKAKDVSAFLAWASDPQAEERTTLGKYVIGYFVFLTILLYFLKKKIWKRLG
ncbi:MAG TPA: cytochrome c1 [Burkholderiales bacterium]|nr:cytochrome c1 [Burkholderiales bacterium]